MNTKWDLPRGLRHMLSDGITQASRVVHQADARFMASSYPNMTTAHDFRLVECAQLDFPAEGDTGQYNGNWTEDGLLSARWPALVFVLEGQCEIRFGVLKGGLSKIRDLPPEIGRYVISVQESQFILLPSKFPRDDGSRPHSQCQREESVHSVLMWFVFVPTGCAIHFCRTHGEEHSISNSIYLPVPQAFKLAMEMESEILSHKPRWETAARDYLELLLIVLEREAPRARNDAGPHLPAVTDGASKTEIPKPHNRIVRAACDFVEDTLHEPIHAAEVAQICDMSTAGLNRLFMACLNMTVSQYIVSRRMERASNLLRDTNLTVKLIAEQSGFPHLEHFSRTFKRYKGVSPLAYRRQN